MRRACPLFSPPATVAIAAALLLAACASRKESPAVVRVAEILNASTMNPFLPNVPVGDLLVEAVFGPGLVSLDPGGGVKPGLASSWTVEPPSRAEESGTLVFDIVPGVTFHDRSPVTARDAVFSLDLARDRGHAPDFARIEPDGDGRVRVAFIGSVERALDAIGAIRILPAHLLEGRDAAALDAWGGPEELPVGAGPFRAVSWTLERDIVLAAHDGALGGAPSIPRLSAVAVPGFFTRPGRIADYLRTEGIHVFRFFDASLAPELAELLPDYRVLPAPTSRQNVLHLAFRLAGPVAGDPAVRRALHAALDRDGIARELAAVQPNASFFPLETLFAPGSWAHPPDLPRAGFDPERADDLLRAAGWLDANGDGVRERRGVPLRLTLGYPAHSRSREQLARRMKIDLAASGIDLVPLAIPLAEFTTALVEGRADAILSFEDFALTARGLRRRFASSGNDYGYASADVDAALAALEGLAGEEPADAAVRARYQDALWRLQTSLASDLPIVPVAGLRHESWLVHRSVEGVIERGVARSYREWRLAVDGEGG